jgi:hypothetical protein
MDETMLKQGGDAKRKELVAMFGDLNIGEDRSKMTEDEWKRAKGGESG